MPYATKDALLARFSEHELVELTDRVEPYQGAIVDAVLDRAAASADAEVEAALRGRYALPLDPAPELVVDLACDLARWRLWDDQAPDAVEARAKAARALLRELAAGTKTLDAPRAGGSGGGRVLFDATAPVFTRETLEGF